MSADFGYINARVRGLKAKLLGSEFFAQALNETDFSAFVSALGQSPYLRDLEEAQARASGLGVVDRAVAANFRRTSRSILGFSDGPAHELIALLLRRYDLMNLKAIARAKHAGRDPEDIMHALLPAGDLKPAVLDAMIAAPDLPAAAQLLAVTRHPLARAFSRAARGYGQDGDLYEFELALDRASFRQLLEDLDGIGSYPGLERHLQREIDATNLRTALKVRGRAVATDELFVPGGKEIRKPTFDAIANDTSQGALANLQGTAFAAVADRPGLSEAETVIRGVLDASARRLALRDPLGIGVVLDYLRQKENESARLRLLARGKYYQVPREQLMKELDHA